MKTAITALAGPLIVVILFMTVCIKLFGPTPLMLRFLVISYGIAIVIGIAVAHRILRRNPITVMRVVLASAILFCAVITCMATAEETFIYFFTKGWAEDAVGRSRHIYPQIGWNADGIRGLPLNLLKMTVTGSVVGCIWGGVLSGIQRLRNRNTGEQCNRA